MMGAYAQLSADVDKGAGEDMGAGAGAGGDADVPGGDTGTDIFQDSDPRAQAIARA
jgi:hypothetical protein